MHLPCMTKRHIKHHALLHRQQIESLRLIQFKFDDMPGIFLEVSNLLFVLYVHWGHHYPSTLARRDVS